jgi:F-type H+-transporting ATPase subunit delta
MAEKSTIARPYAQAVFRLAQEGKALAKWSEMLQAAAVIVGDPTVQALIGNPRVTKEQLGELILEVAGKRLNEPGRHLILLLVENRRLAYMPEVAALYEHYRREAERTVDAQVITAFALNDEQQRSIAAALQARLGRTVTLHQTVDESLVGGVIIRTEDQVIDGSVTAQLEKLSRALAD